jgi:hypothetical protein
LQGVARDFAQMPHAFEDADDMACLDLVDAQLVQRFADHLNDALEFSACVLVLQASLVGLPPFLGELAKQARPFGPALLVALRAPTRSRR